MKAFGSWRIDAAARRRLLNVTLRLDAPEPKSGTPQQKSVATSAILAEVSVTFAMCHVALCEDVTNVTRAKTKKEPLRGSGAERAAQEKARLPPRGKGSRAQVRPSLRRCVHSQGQKQ
jgi:hypothetical protein